MAEIGLELIGRRLDAIQTELREFKFAVDVDRRDAASWRTNLVIEVGAKLATFELRIDNRLAAMDERLPQMDGRGGKATRIPPEGRSRGGGMRCAFPPYGFLP